MGDWHLGVRSNTLEADHRVRRLLATRLIEGVDAPPNYSIWRAGDAHPARGRGVHQLFRSHQKVARSQSFGRILHALCRQLDSHGPQPSDRLRLNVTTVLTEDGGAVLLPAPLFYEVDHLQPQLRRRNLRTLDVAHADLELTTGRVIVDPLDGALDRELNVQAGGDREEPDWARPGLYPVRAWMFRTGHDDRLTRATGVAAAVRLVMNRPSVAGEAMLETLAAAMRSAECIRLPGLNPVDVLESLRERRPTT